MGVANSRFASAGSRSPWDRTPAGPFFLERGLGTAGTLALAPHARTLRLDSGVLAENAYIVAGMIAVRRQTAAAPAGTNVFVEFAPSNSTTLAAYLDPAENAAGNGREIAIPGGVVVPAGETLQMYTRDNSTGGTVDYRMTVVWMTFAV